ncbi:hypothetical protein K488DRAFT_72400 [Vararia minispora EC-137]|uniref:Uncharacterized protein n=1 Tax=Vararia minispora EC-137 TaxID=1314806 RepID=A0ACB8QEU0_9AGAM|nr:hypothetical protein K488DRAFT_72400 [Vararia minispora EC-137]
MSDLRREMSLLSLLYDDDQEFVGPQLSVLAAVLSTSSQYHEYVLASGNDPLCALPAGPGLLSIINSAIPFLAGGLLSPKSPGQPTARPLPFAPLHESGDGIGDAYGKQTGLQAYLSKNTVAATPLEYMTDEWDSQHVSHMFDTAVHAPASVAQPLHALSAASTPGCATQTSITYVSNGNAYNQHASSSRGMYATEDELNACLYAPHASSHEACHQRTPVGAYSTAPMRSNNTRFHALTPERIAFGGIAAERQVSSAPGDATMPALKEGWQKREKQKGVVRTTRAAARAYSTSQYRKQGIPDISGALIRDEVDREALDMMKRQPVVSKARQTEDQRRCAMRYAPKLGKAGILRDQETGSIIFEACKAHESRRLFVDRGSRDRHVQEHHGLLNLIECPKCGKKVKRNIGRHMEGCRI